MTRALIGVAGAAVVCGAVLYATRFPEPRADDSLLRSQVQALTEEVQSLRGQVKAIDRSAGAAGARLASAVALNQKTPQPADETNEERDVRIARETQAHAVKESLYYGRLDEEVRRAMPSADRRAELRKNVDALAAAKLEPAAVTVGAYECSETLCRLELKRNPAADPGKLTAVFRALGKGMREITMRPFDEDRSVMYFAPGTNQLPPMNL
jgi:hypothetical protein